MADQHLIMAEHTMRPLAEELYLPSAIVDRDNREQWTKLGAKDTYQRAIDEVERRLAAYRQPETDPQIDAELRRIIARGSRRRPSCRSSAGGRGPTEAALAASAGPVRRRNPRRGG